MKVFEASAIRNVAFVGHSGAGKTQLASALLFDVGAVPRLGKVDEATTVTDYDDEAIARKHTLSASPAFFEWNKCKVNLIDTPGMGNFLSDARAGLHVADGALIVIDAVSPLAWSELESLGDPVGTTRIWILIGLSRPSDGSQVSPIVSLSRSSWPGFATVGQLSAASQMVSPSVSGPAETQTPV